MTDVNLRAVELAPRNAAQNGVAARAAALAGDGAAALPAELMFDAIALNPPIRAGKQAVHALYAAARERLLPEGSLWIVIRKQQGADSSERFLRTLFRAVETVLRDKGYRVLRARP
jgi:16S rRNA (guanine1207-N2)-methyltransferase